MVYFVGVWYNEVETPNGEELTEDALIRVRASSESEAEDKADKQTGRQAVQLRVLGVLQQ